MAHIEAVCTSTKKGMVKREQAEVVLRTQWGIEHDAHAGDWHRQVSLLAGESIDNVKKVLPTLKNGAFAENLITRGLDLTLLKIGDRLQVGAEIVLEITQIGKECHTGCAIFRAVGKCVMPHEGVFAKVLAGGVVRPGDALEVVSVPTEEGAEMR